MFRCLFFILFLLPGKQQVAAAGFEFTSNCKLAYNHVIELNFVQATQLLNTEKSLHPGNGAVHYIENYRDFLKAFISEEESDFFMVKYNFDKRLDFIEKNSDNSAWINMAKGEMLLEFAILKLKRKEYLSAGYYIRKAFKLLEENQNKYPAFLPNLKALGFLHIVIGAVPENYKWLSNLVGMKGTISGGSNELSYLLSKLEKNDELGFLQTEVSFIKIFTAAHFEKNLPAANAILKKIKSNSITSNQLFTFLEANTYMASGNSSEALKIIKAAKPASQSYPLYYLQYLTGILKLSNLDLEASTNFIKYTENFKGTGFIKSSYHKLAWISLMKNDTSGYNRYIKKVISSGNDFTDEDKQALKEATNKELPNIFLLRSRLLFDGGDYNEALAELTGKPSTSFPRYRDQLEYTYRLARIFDKKGQIEKAIKYYNTTYENGMRTEWYYAANAALHTGMLYETKGDKINAAAWYKKCLELRNHEYQNSIDQKAEAGMNRISE